MTPPSATTQGIACNLQAIPASQRLRYHALADKLRAAVRSRSDLPDGYAFELDADAMALGEVGEWMEMERRCCRFLAFQLSASGNQASWRLTLTGPEGAKAVLQEEFPVR